eukprot:6994518-Heterocapsa_arctica.AAC.1
MKFGGGFIKYEHAVRHPCALRVCMRNCACRQDGLASVLDGARLEADDWVPRDAGDFMRSPAMRFQLRPFK